MQKNTEIPPGWKLPEDIIRRLGSKAGRQRVIAESDDVLIVLHKMPSKDQNHRESLFLWRDSAAKWSASERGAGLSALGDYLNDYSKNIEAIDDRYDKAAKAKDFFELLEIIAPIKRALKNTSNTLQSARELLGEEFIDYRDKTEELYRSVELLYVDSKNGLDYAIAKRTEEQAEIQKQALVAGHRLNMIMALFLPVTAAASLLGMNIPHGLESSPRWVFFSVVTIFGLMGVWMRFMLAKKPKVQERN